ncbi:2-dehydro-3-deoxygluconokinase [Ruegeria sp. THAF57]|uniref:sugar kinase n=1 Tax=Ruegeria sp. THAF57 TaxID=2744555 RepID=UPI0015DF70F5|nr:sugar kinase [Ruegeria sp. THAF57]CAD0186645.1 2-dehydro-3-deoxygluconokinase [Ruegeria sp. THAF57]
MLSFASNKAVAIGEAMIEMADLGDGTYKRGFAGDTFNTAWHMAHMLGEKASIGFVTKVGTDTVSSAFLQQLDEDGLVTDGIGRVTGRTMGLYMIELDGVERSFQYWRETSAARLLAEDRDWLQQVVKGAGLIHLSGITLAILSAQARAVLWDVLAEARSANALVSFDPNIRPRLWTSAEETRETIARFNQITDIAFPSFDDEQGLWGEASPAHTVERLRAAGISEIVVKNGPAPMIALAEGQITTTETPKVEGIRDTSGAGDAFNAGYLSARLSGQPQAAAIAWGQKLSGEVIRHYGARIPKAAMPRFEN